MSDFLREVFHTGAYGGYAVNVPTAVGGFMYGMRILVYNMTLLIRLIQDSSTAAVRIPLRTETKPLW